jgi:RNA polymerase sigma factor (sigma-70 family)
MKVDETPRPIPPATLAHLYLKHIQSARRIAQSRLKDAYLAEDLAHDAFIKAIAHYTDLEAIDRFGAYLRQTVVNLCKTQLRRQRLEHSWRLRAPPGIGVPDPHTEERDELEHLIMALPVRQAIAVVLRYAEDLSEEQTALLRQHVYVRRCWGASDHDRASQSGEPIRHAPL